LKKKEHQTNEIGFTVIKFQVLLLLNQHHGSTTTKFLHHFSLCNPPAANIIKAFNEARVEDE